MNDAELFQFMNVFRDMGRAFPQRLDEHDFTQKGAIYFKAMRRFQVAQVAAGMEAWIQRGKYFPKAAEWIDSIPRPDRQRAEVGALTDQEILDYEDAERRHFEGDPCRCSECRAAGVDHRFTWFVPEVDRDGQDAKAKIGDRIVVRGHWAHGSELARWYAARDAFWVLLRSDVLRRSVPRVRLRAVTAGGE